MSETLEEFKNSFSYGSRADLTFKFLKGLSTEDAGEFLRLLLHEVGESFDTGDVGAIHRLVHDWQVAAYTPAPDATRTYVYDDAPFTPLQRPLAESRVGLLTSSGHFAADDDPRPFGVENMTQDEARDRIQEFLRTTPELSAFPSTIDHDDLRVRHGGYDIRSAAVDADVSLPLTPLHTLAETGRIGEVAPLTYSFTGATSQGRLRKEALPGWVERLHDDDIDVLLLVPV